MIEAVSNMNIWALKKNTLIKHLLLMLDEVFRPGAYDIIDRPDEDLRAIRLGHAAVTDTELYIFTYGQADGRYGIHIEYPDNPDTDLHDIMEIRENTSFPELVSLIIIKLEIPPELIIDKTYG